MNKIFILLASMFLLIGCVESVAVIGGGANGKFAQSTIQSAASYGVKKATGKTPIGHALSYVKEKNTVDKTDSCLSALIEKELKNCLMTKKKIIFKQLKTEEEKILEKPSKEFTLSLQSSINEKSKIKYLD